MQAGVCADLKMESTGSSLRPFKTCKIHKLTCARTHKCKPHTPGGTSTHCSVECKLSMEMRRKRSFLMCRTRTALTRTRLNSQCNNGGLWGTHKSSHWGSWLLGGSICAAMFLQHCFFVVILVLNSINVSRHTQLIIAPNLCVVTWM